MRAASRPPAVRPPRGVTLIELLVVLALMALLATLVVPMLGAGVSTSAMKGAARELAAALRQARSEAMAKREETLVMLDLEGRRFVVGSDPKARDLPKELTVKLYTAQMDLVDDKVGGIRFYPDGGSNGGRVTLAQGERKFEVDVDWLTGRVAIREGNIPPRSLRSLPPGGAAFAQRRGAP